MPMEQVFQHYDKDTLKMAMLKHEETFRQQVHELHRLYRIQKLLMRDLKRELRSQSKLSTSPNGATAKKRYSGNEHSPGQSFSSSSTESDVLVTGVREWQTHGGATADASSPPYRHKRRPAAAFDVVQVDDGGVQQPTPPLLFHWLSLRMA
uniref:Uncharacterized protein n=1 Tax=Oryza brachyantha TaxID=4533 RepID=J3LT32_ORYBR